MFEQTFVDGGQTKRGASVFVSFAIQMLLVAVLAIIPLIYTDVLPKAQLASFLTAPPPPPPPPPPPAQVVKVVKVQPKAFDSSRLMAPREIPKNVAIIQEEVLPAGTTAVVAGGIPGGIPGGLGMGGISMAAPPPPPPEVKVAQVQQIRVGGNVQAANLIKKVTPSYPPLARSARIQGTVRFTAIIGKDGTIQNLQLVSGHPMLVQAATEAVKQWVYKPTLLNNEPVEVITQIDVNFTLAQ